MYYFYRKALFFLLSFWILIFVWILNHGLKTNFDIKQDFPKGQGITRSSRPVAQDYKMNKRKENDFIFDTLENERQNVNDSKAMLFCSSHSNWYLRYFSTKVTTNFSSWTFQEEQNCSSLHIGDKIGSIQSKFSFSLLCDAKTVHIEQTAVESWQLTNEKIPCFDFGDKCLKAYLDKCCYDKKRVPNIVHYVRYQKDTLTFYEFVSFISVIRFVRPCVILIHGDVLPSGAYWVNILKLSPNIIHVKRNPPNEIFGKAILFKEHAGDLMRIQALIEYGGIYLDTDMLIVTSLEPLRKYPCTMSKQGGYMASAFIMAERNAMFLREWIKGYRNHYDENSYVYNAMLYPNKIYRRYRGSIHVEINTISRPWNQIGRIVFKENFDWGGIYGYHIFSRSNLRNVTMESVKYLNSTIGSVCRHVLFGNKELCFYPFTFL